MGQAPLNPNKQKKNAMPYAVCHVEKCKGSLTGLGQHIDREKIPFNADEFRTSLNLELIPPRSANLTDDVNARIAEGYTGNKAIRHDAVKAFKVILSGSHEQMKALEADPQGFRQWQDANMRFLRNRFGEANLVRLTLHMDEKTPHFHAVIVPITKEGKLSAKAMLDGPKAVAQLQTDYANAMQPFGLERGKENSTAKHTDISEYYGRVNAQENAFPDMAIPERTTWEKHESYHTRVRNAVVPYINETLEYLKRLVGQLRGDNERLKKQVLALQKEGDERVKAAKQDVGTMVVKAHKEGKQRALESLVAPLLNLGITLDCTGSTPTLERINPEAQELKRAEEALREHQEAQKKPDLGQNKGGMSL